METSHPIKINNQLIYGRDQIWLISLNQTPDQLTLSIEVDLEESMFLKMIFNGFIFHSSTELDTYEKSKWSTSWLTSQSNFEQIQDSDLINERVKIRDDYNAQDFKHYRVSTYDYIIDVIAKDYQLEEVIK
ncbi:hypothetical protein ACEXFN_002535 [Listeria monocytogenes]|uniref:Uncharacterized protein n=1 Tax=Listeria monocytogenes TaxID=1639 RepID=A0A0B8QVQ7_LISMN|nr:hypothetical protein [Listeria monocytogenes]EAF4534497.1 hypothetical protein [Listeria monocytogenes serotype 1/2a]EAG6333106.1 hypothetical protein [Listeria monocytogenes CFSAN002346]EAG6350981.1 hypothetical protein [Listeria monocytogenes LIS0102]EAG6366540.1 hypothetical protein [Listeria monocytogenes LIS0063]EAG6375850.1 hypothetical protein [Listeria monocytogenes CFSAN002356]EGC3054664.1 hypothetical protein [Listeria monocytogenes CFSAN002357]MBC8921858.1 hypothetical protein 